MMMTIGSKTAAIHAVATVLLSSVIIQFVVAAKIDGNNTQEYASEAKITTLPGSNEQVKGTSISIRVDRFINAHDTTVGNSGNACRFSMNVDLYRTTGTDSGVGIGRIAAREWLVYDVNIPVAGYYFVSYRVASLDGIGRIQLEKAGGRSIYGMIDVPVTGGMQNWTTITHMVVLPAGQQRIGLVFIAGNFALNWIRIAPVFPPFDTDIFIEAEDFVNARDTTAGNSGDACRPSLDVDIYRTGFGDSFIGQIVAGEWLVYDVNIPVAGNYQVSYSVANSNSTGSIQLQNAGGSQIYGLIDVPVTGGMEKWTTITHLVVLPAGRQKIELIFKAGNGFNLNLIRIDEYKLVPGSYELLSYFWFKNNGLLRRINTNNEVICTTSCTTSVEVSDVSGLESIWNVEPVSGTIFMRLRNIAPLKLQNGKLGAAAAVLSDESSHWEFIQEPDGTNINYQLRNRQMPTQYIHVDAVNGSLTVGNGFCRECALWFMIPI